MNWSDWDMIWKRPELPRGADADLASIRETFEVKRRKFSNGLLARDVLEGGAGVVVTAFLAFMWWKQGRSGWPLGVAVGCVLGVTSVFARERLRAQRSRVSQGAPLAARVDAYLNDLQRQRRLLQGMWWWYLAPVAAAIVIVVWTIQQTRPAWDLSRDPLFLGAYFAVTGLMMWGVWVVNCRAVRQRVEPRIVELEKLRASLSSS